MTAPLVEVEDLWRAYGKVLAVQQLSFALERGQVTGFVGPNGAGKTTTMRILATLDIPDRGDARIDGQSVLVEPRAVRRRIGYMSDTFHPYTGLDVMEYLDFFARAHGLRGRRRLETVRQVASFCGLDGFADRPATGLSKGMGQRLHLAKTLLHDPQLLILDEPAAGLDPRARIEFRHLLKELASAGKSILISSHILPELGETCDAVIVLEKGRRVIAGSIAEIQRSVQHEQLVVLRVLQDAEGAERCLLTQPGVTAVAVDGLRLRFAFHGEDEALAGLLQRLLQAGIAVVEFARSEADLEEIFLKTTKGNLQ